jgi:hypothetical protein
MNTSSKSAEPTVFGSGRMSSAPERTKPIFSEPKGGEERCSFRGRMTRLSRKRPAGHRSPFPESCGISGGHDSERRICSNSRLTQSLQPLTSAGLRGSHRPLPNSRPGRHGGSFSARGAHGVAPIPRCAVPPSTASPCLALDWTCAWTVQGARQDTVQRKLRSKCGASHATTAVFCAFARIITHVFHIAWTPPAESSAALRVRAVIRLDARLITHAFHSVLPSCALRQVPGSSRMLFTVSGASAPYSALNRQECFALPAHAPDLLWRTLDLLWRTPSRMLLTVSGALRQVQRGPEGRERESESERQRARSLSFSLWPLRVRAIVRLDARLPARPLCASSS